MGGRGYRPDAYGFGMGWGIWAILGLLTVLVLAATVVWLAVKLNRLKSEPAASVAATDRRGPDALRILDERLARGDLDVADYTARREALGAGTVRGTDPWVDPPA